MIHPQDLRIGNWVLYKGSSYAKLEISDFSELYNNPDFIRFLQPIPITEDILINCGFKQFSSTYGDCYELYVGIEPSYIMGDRVRRLSASPDFEKYFLDDNYLLRIKYLHQLQNLIKSLTQKELEVNL